MSLLSPSSRPTKYLEHRSPKANTSSSLITLITPAINHSLYLADAFRSLSAKITFFVLIKATLTWSYMRYLSITLYHPTRHTTLFLGRQLYWTSKTLWKRSEKTRDKLFYEFMVFVLGGGNAVVLFVFWPGWILVGAGLWVAWILNG